MIMPSAAPRILIATVCLDRTRWGRREPSFAVSEWLERFRDDGFDGVELWQFHYLRADAAEQARLAAAGPIAVYNSYIGFADDGAEEREQARAAVSALNASAVKFNLGADTSCIEEYRRNLLAWADGLPADCRLLCECHPGTVMEEREAAAAFFADLDPERFGVIGHLSGDAGGLTGWFDTFGPRLRHVHVQMRGADSDPRVAANRPPFDACFAVLKRNCYAGTISLEFTRGIGREEVFETVYANACTDLAYCREALSC